jgi:hypothetical protein
MQTFEMYDLHPATMYILRAKRTTPEMITLIRESLP